MKAALERAVLMFTSRRDEWAELRRQVMLEDCSWHKSVVKYIELYYMIKETS